MPRPKSTAPLHAEGFLLGDLVGKMYPIFDEIRRERCPESSGGYFCFCEVPSGSPFAVVKFGFPGMWERHLQLCQEKARRLADRKDHDSSHESRDPARDQFGGAIRVYAPYVSDATDSPVIGLRSVILSFDGFFREELDELFMLRAAERFDMTVPPKTASRILKACSWL